MKGDLSMAYLKTKPYSLRCDEGQRLKSMGASISVKASSKQTSGAFNLFDIACPPGFSTPMHIHYTEDVAVFVLEGTLTIFWGSEKKEAVIGSYFYQPRGTPHGFRVAGTMPARILYMTTPAGLDQLISEQELPAPYAEPETAAARYKIEVLGPLPE
jgi:quercetin dioxygenase-like cupin family protein